MIKNLIFDIDNTIIKDEKSDSLYYKEALRKCGYNEEKYLDIYMAIDKYDKIITEDNIYYNKEKMLETINETLNTNYSMKLIDELLEIVAKYWIQNVIIKENVIKELSNKYNLYAYTNYFTESQTKRLENIGYLKYFKKVFGADIYGSKPFKKSIEKILEELNSVPEECIMIGDDKNRDVLVANKVGMRSILYDYDGKRDKKEYDLQNYTVLKDINKLTEIL